MERLEKKLYFIYNPLAGKGNIRGKLYEIIQTLASSEYEVTVYPMREPRDAIEKVRELPDDYDLIVCSGGDGTLDEVVTGMMQREHKIPIGYIPAGSCNDFARSLQIPNNMQQAAEIAVQTVKNYREQTHSKIEVIFNVFKESDYILYRNLLGANP